MSKLIPKEKTQGLRHGQLIYAAIMNHAQRYRVKNLTDKCKTPISGSADHYIADELFQIENDQLEAAVARVLEGIGTPETTTSQSEPRRAE